MDLEEWRAYLVKIEHCDYPLPAALFADYNDWRNRSVVGRMLFILKDVEGAMRVLSTVRECEPNFDDDPEYGLSEVEHKTLCLRDLGEIVWLLAADLDAALSYLDAAYAYCRSYPRVFRSANRGRIWLRRLELKRAAGRGEEAFREAAEMLAAEPDKPRVNPYRFYAYVFLAEDVAARGDYEKACALIRAAYGHFPESRAADEALARAAAAGRAAAQWPLYHHATEIQYVPWEELQTPDIDEIRRRQYAKFLEREKAAQAKEKAEDVK